MNLSELKTQIQPMVQRLLGKRETCYMLGIEGRTLCNTLSPPELAQKVAERLRTAKSVLLQAAPGRIRLSTCGGSEGDFKMELRATISFQLHPTSLCCAIDTDGETLTLRRVELMQVFTTGLPKTGRQ